ncbi:hypothetical protein I9X38_18595 [Bacillus mojavensis]|nr:hypothetical protein I9X38_18595 [Bacillus mojavensis]
MKQAVQAGKGSLGQRSGVIHGGGRGGGGGAALFTSVFALVLCHGRIWPALAYVSVRHYSFQFTSFIQHVFRNNR